MAELVIRADADATLGAGHVMRCLTLAEAWRDAGLGTASLWGRVELPFVAQRLSDGRIPVVASDPRTSNGTLVVDTYDGAERRRVLSRNQALRVVVDDLGWPPGSPDECEAVWNPNAYGTPALYQWNAGEVITGPDAVPIRGGLPVWRPSDDSDVIISLGGGKQPAHITAALSLLTERQPGVRFASTTAGASGTRQISPDRLWQEVAQSRALITGAGTTVWEAAFVGVPIVILLLADNQSLVASYATEQGVPVVDASGESPDAIAGRLDRALAMATPLRRLVNGAPHVARRLSQLLQSRASIR